MGFYAARLRRAIPLCSSVLHHHHFHTSKIISPVHSIASTLPHALNPGTYGTSQLSGSQSFRLFRSSPVSLSSRRQRFDDEKEITEDTILFEGCDYNHWLITVDFPKDTPAEEKIAAYERAAAEVFGSMEEAKKRIYACSTTVYDGFQVECSEATSEMFKDVAGVVFVLPDSYIDPVNKRYGGDKYVNGEIIPMPPPINYMKRESRPRQQRFENRGQMSGYENRGTMQGEARRFGPPQNLQHQQNFGPPQNLQHQQNFGPPQNPQSFGPQQNMQHQRNFGPPQNPQHQRNFGPPQNVQHQQNFGPPQNPEHQQNVGHPQNPPRQQYFVPQNPSFQQNFGPQRGPAPQQNYPSPQDAPPHQNYGVQHNFSPQQNSSSGEMRVPSQQSHTPPGGVRHEYSTIAPGVGNHHGRTDFPQGFQTGYTSASTSVTSSSGSFGHDVAGGTEKELGPEYGHQNYSGHVEDQKFSKVDQSRI